MDFSRAHASLIVFSGSATLISFLRYLGILDFGFWIFDSGRFWILDWELSGFEIGSLVLASRFRVVAAERSLGYDDHGDDLAEFIQQLGQSASREDPGFDQELDPIDALVGSLFDDGQLRDYVRG